MHINTMNAQQGFSLIEMAIVLFIIAVLMGGLLPTISSQIEQKNRTETRKQLDEIQQAIYGYVLTNGRLPCPADQTKISGQANAGLESTTGAGPTLTCSATWGVLPWATLGVNETDGWGRRFSYYVTIDFADAINLATYGSCTPSPAPTLASFALCSNGNLTIKSATTGTNIASNIPAVIISHGPNGLGAYSTQGTQIPNAGASADEVANAVGAGATIFVSHDTTPTFDDLVIWISPNILNNRMVTAGKLP